MNTYEIVTEQIIKQLESGTAPWRKPWRCEPAVNLVSQKEYRGINQFLLGASGFGSKFWLTFNQCSKFGGRVKAGEKSSIVVFWNIGPEKTRIDAEGKERKSKPILLRYYRVFNLTQTEGLAEKLGLSESAPRIGSIADCEAIVANMPNRPKQEQSAAAWYRPASDTVGMPARELFSRPEEFYSTLFHELTHSTGHASRIGRPGIEQVSNFGSESYSNEELVAELGASMLCGIAGISPATLENSASYLAAWISRLKSDSRLIVTAASAAQKAADYICGLSKPVAETEGPAV
jgi:antirestriction protein ArdC